MNDSKLVAFEIPRNVADNFLNFDGADFDGVISSKQVADLDDCGIVISFKEFSHNDGDPITFFTDNDIALLDMFGPCSPFSFDFGFDIINEDFSDCH